MQSLDLHINVQTRKSWLQGIRTVEISAVITPQTKQQPEIYIGEVFEQLLLKISTLQEIERHLREHEGKDFPPLINIRGRPGESFSPAINIPKSRQGSLREELALLKGRIIEEIENTEEETEQKKQSHQFSMQILSQFRNFDSSGKIVHDVVALREGALPAFLPSATLSDVSRLVPAKIDLARFGFETYKSQYVGAWLGLTPKIDSRLYVELSPQKVTITLSAEGALASSELPEKVFDWTRSIHEALTVCSSLQFQNAVQEALKK